jgi:hypothetical protein
MRDGAENEAKVWEAFADLMDFDTWVERSGQARLLTQLEALPACPARPSAPPPGTPTAASEIV